MSFMTSIIDALNLVSDWFYRLYLEAYGWVYPFWLVADFFYHLSQVFSTLAWRFWDFSSWVSEVQGKVGLILSWDTIWSMILSVVPNLTQIRDWFYSWADNVRNVVTTWWSAAQSTVLAWVQDAKNLSTTLFNQATASLLTLQSDWDSFKALIPAIDQVIAWWGNWSGNVLTVVNAWWDARLITVQGLINSAFTARESLWAGWQDMRAQVVDFFTDPEAWLYKAADRIVERFW